MASATYSETLYQKKKKEKKRCSEPCCHLPSKACLQTETCLLLSTSTLLLPTTPYNSRGTNSKALLDLSPFVGVGPWVSQLRPTYFLCQLRPALEVESFSQDGRLLPSQKAQSKAEGQAGFQNTEPKGKRLDRLQIVAGPGSRGLECFQPCPQEGRFASRAR